MNNREKIENEVIGNVVTIRPTDDGDPVEHDKGVKWPDPQPLTVKVPPEPYPVDSLPKVIRAAIDEVFGFTKAPIPMIASSALSALSVAIQPHVDIERASGLTSPVGCFFITLGNSGERKTTVDTRFMAEIRAYEKAQIEAAKPLIKDYKAKLSAWEAKYSGIKDKIRDLSKKGSPTSSLESDLCDLEHTKPEPPLVPQLLYGDTTPEALAHSLATEWPSGAVVCAEAGIVFGSHGMGKDSITRNLGTLNHFYDGSTDLKIKRRSVDSFTVQGARLTVSLMVQEATLRDFYGKSGALARGTGFFARFLIAWPESMQGYRPFTDPPDSWPAMAEFNRRINSILNEDAPIDKNGGLQPVLMRFSREAKAAWVAFYDEIERQLRPGGDLHEVQDVASKTADNAARLSALLQVFEHGFGGVVGLDCFECASAIAAWHLYEARRFFGELSLPVELANAARLDSWLIEYCRRVGVTEVPKNYARQHGALRDGAMLDAAIKELHALDRVRLVKEGRKLILRVNPALMVQP